MRARRDAVEVLAIEALIIIIIWFGFSGLNRNNSLAGGLVWAATGGLIFWAALLISGYLVDTVLMRYLQASIAINGIYVLSTMSGILIAFGCCFLAYKVSSLGRA